MPHNKNRQYAPTGPDAKTAGRFRRHCGRRYASSCERTNNVEVSMSVLIPPGEQIVKLRSFPADEPVGALNLFHMYK